jgi:hypothetical protein
MLDFLGIGTQKAGTTWLYAMLSQHPGVRFPAGKEVHFWNRHRDKGVDWYRAQFAEKRGVKNGEITPAYSILPAAVVREVREINPALRVVYLLRNPIERAWSAALMWLQRAELELDEASDQWFIDYFRSRGALARADYESCLRTWRGAFGDEAVLVMRYEVLQETPAKLLEAVCRHIGVDPAPMAKLPAANLARRVWAGPGHAIRPSLLPLLRELHRPKIASLERYLGMDLSAWRET